MSGAPGGVAARMRELLDFLLPGACVGCGGRLPASDVDDLVCAPCLAGLRPPSWPRCPRCAFPLGTAAEPADACLECRDWPPALAAARSAFQLRPPADALVHGLKYGGWAGLARPMGRRMARVALPGRWADEAVVVPVPTTRRRERRRGYNQAALLARSFAEAKGLSVVDGLGRRGHGATQVALHPTQRRANVENAFFARPGFSGSLRGRGVLLVDDVLTTGATAAAAARALHREGVSDVCLLTFARALPFRQDDPTPVR